MKNQVPANSAGAIDLDGIWTARDYPCDGGDGPLDLRLDQRDADLRATNTRTSACIAAGYEVFRGKLPKRSIFPADLPLTIDVETALRATGEKSELADGELTLANRDVLVLDLKGDSITIERRAPSDASIEDPRDAESERASDGGESSRPPGRNTGTAGARNAVDPSAGVGGSGAGGSAAGSGGRGPASQSAAGRGGAGVAAPAAGSGGMPGSSEAGSGSDWFCAPASESCTCLRDQPGSADLCTNKPTCCFTLVAFGSVESCQCWPSDSPTCLNQPTEQPDAKSVTTCPPP